MLDAFIIDELKRREVEERDDAGRPRLEIPDPADGPPDEGEDAPKDSDDKSDDEKKDRGVVVIDT